MGTNNSKSCELNEYGDVCQMTSCLGQNIIGLKSDSTSPTDTMIVEFKDGTTYEGKPIKTAFLKIWLSNETFKYADENIIKLSNYETRKFELSLDFAGLDYEVKVYRDIIKPLIETNICPNFIKFLGSGKNCSFHNVATMISGPLNDAKIVKAFHGNTIRILKGEKRKSINEVYNINELKKFVEITSHVDVVKYFTYNILANEVIKSGTVTMSRFLYNKNTDKTIISTVLFQALAACYAMSCSKMVHNDLHLSNIYVEPLEKTTRMNYIYGGDLYTFETDYIIKVFDFDRAYVKRFGENPLLDADTSNLCDHNSQCNKYIENLDALKLMSGTYRKLKKDLKNEILNICTMNGKEDIEKSNRILKEVFEESNFLTHNDFPLTIDKYQLFNSTIDIMKNLSRSSLSNGSIQSTYPVGYIPDLEYTFICNKDMFDDQGKIADIKVTKAITDKTTIDELQKKVKQLETENKSLRETLFQQGLTKEGLSK